MTILRDIIFCYTTEQFIKIPRCVILLTKTGELIEIPKDFILKTLHLNP